MSVMNVKLPDGMHRRLAATAAACGVTMKEAVVEAARSWIEQHAAETAAALGFAPAREAATKTVATRRATPPRMQTEPAPAPASPAVVKVAEPPPTDRPVEVVARTASAEPGSQVNPWATAGEVLRLGGVAGSVVLGASAQICGKAACSVESE